MFGERRVTRRHWLRKALGLGLGLTAAGLLKRVLWPAPLDAAERRTLTALVDTLVPADEQTPAASALGIDRSLWQRIDADRAYRYLMHSGLRWLDANAPDGRFDLADEQQKDRLLCEAAAMAPDTVPGAMFRRLRHEAMDLYYADPRSWVGLGFYSPPQPVGFADFTGPARHRG